MNIRLFGYDVHISKLIKPTPESLALAIQQELREDYDNEYRVKVKVPNAYVQPLMNAFQKDFERFSGITGPQTYYAIVVKRHGLFHSVVYVQNHVVKLNGGDSDDTK